MPRLLGLELSAAIANIDFNVIKQWQAMGGFQLSLSRGDKSNQVKLVQLALAYDPTIYPGGTATGAFGDETRDAVVRFQQQYGLTPSGVVDKPTQKKLNEIFFNQLCPTPTVLYPDLSLAHITPTHALPQDYVPPDLVDITNIVPAAGIECVTNETASALIVMFKAAQHDGITLAVSSGYRRPEIQQLIHYFWVQIEGEEKANHDSAQPFHSEHQLGTTVDLAGKSNNFRSVDDNFNITPEGRWLIDHAYIYGFSASYPSQNNAGYVYEPWHWRYVGKELATTLHTLGISYTEYAGPHVAAQLHDVVQGTTVSASSVAVAYVSPLQEVQTLMLNNALASTSIYGMQALLYSGTSTQLFFPHNTVVTAQGLVDMLGTLLAANKSFIDGQPVDASNLVAAVSGASQTNQINTVFIAKLSSAPGYLIGALLNSTDVAGDEKKLLALIDADYVWSSSQVLGVSK